VVDEADNGSRTTILKAEFGANWRWWAWFRKQWSAMSLTVVGACGAALLALGHWALNVQTRVVVLETQVVPVLKDESRVDKLEAKYDGHETRIANLEADYRTAQEHAADRPVPTRRRDGR
jgi:hypothetical protein